MAQAIATKKMKPSEQLVWCSRLGYRTFEKLMVDARAVRGYYYLQRLLIAL